MVLNPFQEGQNFASQERARRLAAEAAERREEGIAAIAERRGPEFLAPDVAVPLRGQDLSVEQAASVQDRFERTQGFREDEAELARVRQSGLDARTAADEDLKRRISATRAVIGATRSALDSGVPLDQIAARIGPALLGLGFTEQDLAGLPQILQDPANLDAVEDALISMQGGIGRGVTGQPIPVFIPGPPGKEDELVLGQQLEDGTFRIIPGVTPASPELRRQGLDPGLRGRRREEEIIGGARGERIAEDLPPSRSEVIRTRNSLDRRIDRTMLVIRTIDQAIGQVGNFTAGPGSILSNIPGTPASDLEAVLTTIRANIGFEELQNIRDASPTGGALGQVSNLELEALQNVLASIQQTQSPEQLRFSLGRLKDTLESGVIRLEQGFIEDFGRFEDAVTSDDPTLDEVLERNLRESEQLTGEELRGRPRLMELRNQQLNPSNALEGELGVFTNPDGSFSTERSSTVEIDGRIVNIPLLVKGQSSAAIDRILADNPSQEDIDLAIKRALEREKEGLALPSFSNLEEAVKAARKRSGQK